MPNDHQRARNRGKWWERRIAGILKGKRRIGYKGTACSDIEGLPWAVEVTCTKKGVGAIRTKWAQAVTNALIEGLPPVLVVAEPRKRWEDALAVCYFGLFAELAEAKRERDLLVEVLRETLDLASVSYDGDIWFAESAGIRDPDAVLARAHRALMGLAVEG